jgi:hypothetical protein
MRLYKLVARLIAVGLMAASVGQPASGIGLFDACEKDCDAGICDTASCDADACDGEANSLVRRGPVPGMFGDGGLIIPRIFGRVGSPASGFLQLNFQNHAYKVAENNSALPQDRIGFNFNAMQDVYIGELDGRIDDDIYEYRLFGEKTFLDGRFSVDLMLPFYTTSAFEYEAIDALTNGPQTEGAFGDLAFGFKALVYESCTSACSLGLRVEAPTGEDIVSPPGFGLVYSSINDDVWNFTPYVASLWTPSERTFIQSFLSYRLTSSRIEEVENPLTIREQSYFMADVSVGYWLYRNRCGSCLTGLAPMLELHYTGAWDEESAFNSITGPRDTLTNVIYGQSDRLSLTAGLSAFFGQRCSAGIAVAAPLRSNESSTAGLVVDSDRAYDWALLTQLTYYFGR